MERIKGQMTAGRERAVTQGIVFDYVLAVLAIRLYFVFDYVIAVRAISLNFSWSISLYIRLRVLSTVVIKRRSFLMW